MKAFHNDKAIKAKYLARVKAHQKADNLVRGFGWDGHRGCAIGCTLEVYDHARYPIELGVPIELARLEDRIFEGMPLGKAKKWPAEFLRAIQVGADLSTVWPRFAVWLLKDVQKFARPDGQAAIDTVIRLYREGVPRTDPRWKEAKAGAYYAAAATYSAAAAAAYAYAYYAYYAYAYYASPSAAAATYSAAREGHFYRQSRRLLDILRTSK